MHIIMQAANEGFSILPWIPMFIAIVAPLGAYILASRRFSGKVQTSEATALWAESASMREDYRKQLKESREEYRAEIKTAYDRIQNLEMRIVNLENTNDTLAADNRNLRIKVSELEKALVDKQ